MLCLATRLPGPAVLVPHVMSRMLRRPTEEIQATRPLLMRLLPVRARQCLLSRWYRARRDLWRDLYSSAHLRYAPGVAVRELLPGDVISDSIAFTGSYEDALSRRLARSARAGGLLVDVGANIGYMSLLWTAQSAEARAIAIEASPRVFPRLQANVAANQLMERVTTLNVAAGRDAGSLP